MSPEIRPAGAADVPALLPLVEQYWIFEDIAHFDPTRVGRALGRALSDPDLMSGWVASARGQAVGYLLAVYVFSLEHLGLTAEIDEFFILPSARGKGLGESLLRHAEAEFLRRGCTNVALQLGRGNERARLFYRALGYREREGFELLDKMLPDRRES
jgi:GNAT superfamily N-acetyltransferase